MEQQVIVIVIFAAIGLLNFLVERAKKKRDENLPPTAMPPIHTPSPAQPSREARADRQMRKFMEALGLPADNEPPPPVQQRLPERKAAPQPQPRQKPKKLPAKTLSEADRKPEVAMPISFSTPKIRDTTSRQSESRPSPLRKMLRSREGLRQAVVLREILGAPKALQGDF